MEKIFFRLSINTYKGFYNLKANLFKKVVELYCDKLDEVISDKKMNNLQSGKSSVVSMEEVLKKQVKINLRNKIFN